MTPSRRFGYQQLAEPVVVPAGAEIITLDKWWSPASEPVRARAPKPIFEGETHAFALAQWPVPDLSWGPVYPDFIRASSRAPEFPFLFWYTETPAAAEVITLDKWWEPASEPIRRRAPSDIPSLFWHTETPVPAEVITLDKWAPTYPDRPLRILRAAEFLALTWYTETPAGGGGGGPRREVRPGWYRSYTAVLLAAWMTACRLI
jgi:hypothetical protein